MSFRALEVVLTRRSGRLKTGIGRALRLTLYQFRPIRLPSARLSKARSSEGLPAAFRKKTYDGCFLFAQRIARVQRLPVEPVEARTEHRQSASARYGKSKICFKSCREDGGTRVEHHFNPWPPLGAPQMWPGK